MPKKADTKAEPSAELDIPFRDGTVTVPRERGKWPTRAVLALQKVEAASEPRDRTENLLKAIELALGPKQWTYVTDSTVAEFDDFCDAFFTRTLQEVFTVSNA